jgi:hypothetical protein
MRTVMTGAPPETFSFGLLDALWQPIQFHAGEIRPRTGEREVDAWLDEAAAPDGWIYPPVGQKRQQGHLWRVPTTHELLWTGGGATGVRRDEPKFLLDVLGFAYGRRLQFSEWWIDLRVPRRPGPFLTVYSWDVAPLLERASAFWRAASERNRKRLSSTIYLLSRAEAAHWFWEKFLLLYTALDACWMVLKDQGRVVQPKGGHSARIKEVCRALSLYGAKPDPVEADRCADKLKDIRNDLAHEAIWDVTRDPAHTHENALGSSDATDMEYHQIRELVRQIVLEILEIPSDRNLIRWYMPQSCWCLLRFPAPPT